MAPDPALEAKLLENPNDSASYLVYADLLQSKGDPRGELISLQVSGKHEEAEALLSSRAEELLGPLAQFRTTHEGVGEQGLFWRNGFIRKAVLGFDSNDADDELSVENALEALLGHPSGALLEDLTLTINMKDDGCYFTPPLEVLAEKGAPGLRSLRIGRFSCCGGPGGEGDYEYEISWTGVGDMSRVWKALPRLETLVIQSGLGGSSANGDRDVFGAIDLPKLQTLKVITGGLGQEPLSAIAKANWPALRDLELWFGDENYGQAGGVDDLWPLLAGEKVPKLERLALCNSDFADDLAAALTKAPVVKQLKELSLRYGTLTDAGARALLGLPNLKSLTLDVRDNFVSEGVLDELKAAAGGFIDGDQREPYDEDRRYVALSE